MTAEAILKVLRAHRGFSMINEGETQMKVAKVLTDNGIHFAREVRLSERDRIDFLCEGGIGIEVKVKGGRMDYIRQLKRYEEHDSIKSLVLVTARYFPGGERFGITKFAGFVWLSRGSL